MSASRKRHTSKTATELLAELAADPAYQARRAEQDRELRQRAEEDRRAEAPLVTDLHGVGVAVESVLDLVNRASPYPDAVPVLLDHLQRPYPQRVREGIARALAVPESKSGWMALRRAFQQEEDPTTHGVKWALACALGAAADEEVIRDVAALAREARHGLNRLAFVKALRRSRDPLAAQVLEELRQDPAFEREIVRTRGGQR
jgi:hypothetical protein